MYEGTDTGVQTGVDIGRSGVIIPEIETNPLYTLFVYRDS